MRMVRMILSSRAKNYYVILSTTILHIYNEWYNVV